MGENSNNKKLKGLEIASIWVLNLLFFIDGSLPSSPWDIYYAKYYGGGGGGE